MGKTEPSDPSIFAGFHPTMVQIWAKRRGRGNFKWVKIYDGQYFFPFHQPTFSPLYTYWVVFKAATK